MTADRAAARPSDDYADVAAQFESIANLDDNDPEREIRRDGLIERCLPLAEHIARRFDGRGEPHDDLLQVARLGLVKAVDRFDITNGADFVSFAVPTIMGEVRRHFRDTGWALRVPRRMKELHVALNQAIGNLSQQLGRTPTVSELARELGVDADEVNDGLAAGNAYNTVSVDRTVTSEGLPLVDSLADFDDAITRVDNHEALRPLLEELPERERIVLLLRFFGNLTQSEIAAKVGVSQIHVSRILAKTLTQLRERLE